jgi:hypothetical protein
LRVLFLMLLSACGAGSRVEDTLARVARFDASIPDSGAAPDSGVEGPVRFRDIALTVNARDYLSFPPFDGGELPLTFPRRDDVRAQWRHRDEGWGLATGSLLDDGGYLIPAVPEGDAVIFVRSSPFAVVTTESFLDLSYVVSGRKDAVAAPPNLRRSRRPCTLSRRPAPRTLETAGARRARRSAAPGRPPRPGTATPACR